MPRTVGLKTQPLLRQRPLTVSFFLLKTGMATVVRSTRLCACEAKSCREERAEDRGLRIHSARTHSHQCQLSCHLPTEEAIPMRFPFSAKGELAETLEESGGLGRRTRRTSLSQGESQNPRAHGPAPKQAHYAPLSRMSVGPWNRPIPGTPRNNGVQHSRNSSKNLCCRPKVGTNYSSGQLRGRGTLTQSHGQTQEQ